MSLWQFHAVMDGWNRANDPNADKKIRPDEEDQLWALIQEDESGG